MLRCRETVVFGLNSILTIGMQDLFLFIFCTIDFFWCGYPGGCTPVGKWGFDIWESRLGTKLLHSSDAFEEFEFGLLESKGFVNEPPDSVPNMKCC